MQSSSDRGTTTIAIMMIIISRFVLVMIGMMETAVTVTIARMHPVTMAHSGDDGDDEDDADSDGRDGAGVG